MRKGIALVVCLVLVLLAETDVVRARVAEKTQSKTRMMSKIKVAALKQANNDGSFRIPVSIPWQGTWNGQVQKTITEKIQVPLNGTVSGQVEGRVNAPTPTGNGDEEHGFLIVQNKNRIDDYSAINYHNTEEMRKLRSEEVHKRGERDREERRKREEKQLHQMGIDVTNEAQQKAAAEENRKKELEERHKSWSETHQKREIEQNNKRLSEETGKRPAFKIPQMNTLCIGVNRVAFGERVRLVSCNGGGSVDWDARDDGSIRPTTNAGLCMDFGYYASEPRVILYLYSCHLGGNQRFNYDGDKFRASYDGRQCIGSTSRNEGSLMWAMPCDDGSSVVKFTKQGNTIRLAS